MHVYEAFRGTYATLFFLLRRALFSTGECLPILIQPAFQVHLYILDIYKLVFYTHVAVPVYSWNWECGSLFWFPNRRNMLFLWRSSSERRWAATSLSARPPVPSQSNTAPSFRPNFFWMCLRLDAEQKLLRD